MVFLLFSSALRGIVHYDLLVSKGKYGLPGYQFFANSKFSRFDPESHTHELCEVHYRDGKLRAKLAVDLTLIDFQIDIAHGTRGRNDISLAIHGILEEYVNHIQCGFSIRDDQGTAATTGLGWIIQRLRSQCG